MYLSCNQNAADSSTKFSLCPRENTKPNFLINKYVGVIVGSELQPHFHLLTGSEEVNEKCMKL